MALAQNNLELFLWIQKNRGRLDLSISENLPYRRLTGVHAYSVVLKLHGVVRAGYGYDPSPIIALNKAFSEVVERFYCVHRGGLSTSGYATHFLPDAARTSARLELIERDAFLSHFLTETPFVEIDAEKIVCPSIDLQQIRSRLEKRGCSLSLFRMNSDFRVQAVMAVISGDQGKVPFGMKVAASTSPISLEAAVQSAVLESTACASGLLFAKPGTRVIAARDARSFRVLSRGVGIPSVHTNAACRFEYSKEFKSVYLQRRSRIPEGRRPLEEVRVVRLKAPTLALARIPLVCFRATDPSLQHLYFGVAKPHYFNHERLKRLGGMKLKKGFPSRNPHPFP